MRLRSLAAVVVMMMSPILMGDVLLWSVTEDTPVYHQEVEQDYQGTIKEYLLSHQDTIPWDGTDHLLAARVGVWNETTTVPLRYMEDRIAHEDWDAYTKSYDTGYPKTESKPNATGFGVTNAKSEDLNSLGDAFWYQVEIIAGTRNAYDPNYIAWHTILYSDKISGQWLDDYGHYNTTASGDDTSGLTPWIPERFYEVNPSITPYPVIPEPSV